MRILFAALRAVGALAIIAAIIGQLITSVNNWHAIGLASVTTQVVNFFSFFTIESNVLAAVVLGIGVWLLLRRPSGDPRWYSGLRGAAVTYMVVTGIVYNLLLRGIELPQGTTLPWSNEVLHLIGPLYLLIDWLFAPGRGRLEGRNVWPILIFPIVWCIYTLVRGPLVFDAVTRKGYWYPYPFLNPNTSKEGYFTVTFYIVLIAAVIGLTALGIVWLSKRRMPAVGSPPARPGI